MRTRGESNVIGKTSRRGNYVTEIRSPKVVAHARDYFKCSRLSGVEIENNGGSGSAGSHWERVILGNEMMTASEIDSSVFSKFTLALLEDTGWY